MPLTYHPEFYAAIEPLIPLMAASPKPARHDIQARRTNLQNVLGGMLNAIPTPQDITRTTHTTKSSDGYEVTIYQYSKNDTVPGPAILHIHGGGYIAGSVPILEKGVMARVSQTGVPFFSVEYRLAPEHPYPAPLEDCYAALLWLQQSASTFDIDPTRIAIMGESAGGGLAAALAIMARDKNLTPPIKKQILIYPMLDDRNTTPNPDMEARTIWTIEDNITGWSAYLGVEDTTKRSSSDDVSPLAAPARVASVEGLPPTYIDVGTLDNFRDEDMKFATRLMEANVDIDFHVYQGVPHGFEILAPNSTPTKVAMVNRMNAIMSI